MTEPEYNTGSLFMPYSDDRDDERSVSYRYVDSLSGELRVTSGKPLLEGEIYVLAADEQNRRIEVVKAAQRHLPDDEPWTEYLFRAA